MKQNITFPSGADAEKLLAWAQEQNPGQWAAHCRTVARAAQTIAERSGLGAERAYVSGLLHDIGRYEGISGLRHIYAGYALMIQNGYGAVAQICLSHSFPYQDIQAFGGGAFDCSPEEIELIVKFLAETAYTDYDRLIQLCDAMGIAQGVCVIEKRLVDVTRRHGFNSFTLKKWDSIFQIKEHFDNLCGEDIYNLFYDEIKANVFCKQAHLSRQGENP